MSRAKMWANFEVLAKISCVFFLDQHKNLNDHLAPLVGNPCSNHTNNLFLALDFSLFITKNVLSHM